MAAANNLYDVVVIGGGPAGLTAGLYLARACYRVLVVEKEKFGGQITITSEVVNFPGVERASGTELTEHMRRQAENFGAEFLLAEVESLDLSGDVRKVRTSRGEIECFGILIATGAHPRMIGFEGEAEFRGHGVAYCATCDGEFFTGKEVFVVGGGFAAAEESVFLTKYASHVTILIRGADFTCAKATADEARNHPKITVRTHTVVDRVEGDAVLRALTWRNTQTGESATFRPENGESFGVFVFAGYEPSSELVRGLVDLDEQGYIVTDRDQKTTLDGVYAAGDVCIKKLRQCVTAAGDGALAATELEKYCSAMQKKTGLKPEMPVKRSERHQVIDSGKAPAGSTEPPQDGLFTAGMIEQLRAVFDKMARRMLLKLYLDERPISQELAAYADALSELTDKLALERVEAAGPEQGPPCARICASDGAECGLAFHGVPGGHEFTSFILGLYNAAGPGQQIDEALRERAESIDHDVRMEIMVSLSCTLCPDLVIAAQRIASLNPRVRVDVYDLNHFGELKTRYNVMSVPCFVINGGPPMFGKKSIEELLNLM